MFESQRQIISNRFPAWKYLLIIAVVVLGITYAMPNLFGDDPSVQVSSTQAGQFNERTTEEIEQRLIAAGLTPKLLSFDGNQYLIRFDDVDTQLQANDLMREMFGRQAVVALNLAPATPGLLRAVGGQPMYLGLDLRGGVHFLMDVDMDAAVAGAYRRFDDEVRNLLRDERVRYQTVEYQDETLRVIFRSAEARDQGLVIINREMSNELQTRALDEGEQALVEMRLASSVIAETKRFALQQNITTLRNRINELGVAEPVIQQQGERRIVVQLPGVQDTARAKEILGATATLEFRLVDERGDAERAERTGAVPPNTQLFNFRDGRPILLQRNVIVTGESVINAQSGIDAQQGSPQVSVTLDGAGGRRMLATTRDNIGNRMAVVFIESRVETVERDGELVRERIVTRDVINAAVIRDQFANRFQITGLSSSQEAQNLALLLRAGALAAPMEIVEERTVGPSLGQDNINQGLMSVIFGFILVLIIMAWRYKAFGMIANVALTVNLVVIVAVLSLLQATLTLPGIAGIVLTVGMAVDANVLIFERIREEMKKGSIQNAIHSGYEKAFVTIADANITTLIAAIVLFSFGTGPIKGFAITLSIGIATSMFTAILLTRGLVNWRYGNKRVTKLWI
ncbi:protein translocase subunit SecD [Thiomicrospira cyclica]|uniref:Protein translocase subunit SecD n=1 Tax=Thiomicrospira cyclica (strain DSM 14477 / JCM 11371 / ALM1) TaxID=717773 RepID=F6DD18_THICA|nr:protein translocase subunit SecD [Thiomicrospira cyclica]AEG31754.1 protein-export membrane protein SecD [Thiomicrospira cyclica ALM1]